ncbi:MAG: hypothetical protein R3E08_02965 [Thiotrichaceae bacterium]
MSTSAVSENYWFFIGTLLLGTWGLAAIRPGVIPLYYGWLVCYWWAARLFWTIGTPSPPIATRGMDFKLVSHLGQRA